MERANYTISALKLLLDPAQKFPYSLDAQVEEQISKLPKLA